MGYFSNGTEGMEYESEYCSNCINWRERDGIEGIFSCPVWDVHFEHNYAQHNKTKAGKVIREILETLIPTQEDGLFADECSMFIDREHIDDDPEREYLRQLQTGKLKAPVLGVPVK